MANIPPFEQFNGVWPPNLGQPMIGGPPTGLAATHDGYVLESDDMRDLDVQSLSIQSQAFNPAVAPSDTKKVTVSWSGPWSSPISRDLYFSKVGKQVTATLFSTVGITAGPPGAVLQTNTFSLPDTTWLPGALAYNTPIGANTQIYLAAVVVNNGIAIGQILFGFTSGDATQNSFQVTDANGNELGNFAPPASCGFSTTTFMYQTD